MHLYYLVGCYSNIVNIGMLIVCIIYTCSLTIDCQELYGIDVGDEIVCGGGVGLRWLSSPNRLLSLTLISVSVHIYTDVYVYIMM